MATILPSNLALQNKVSHSDSNKTIEQTNKTKENVQTEDVKIETFFKNILDNPEAISKLVAFTQPATYQVWEIGGIWSHTGEWIIEEKSFDPAQGYALDEKEVKKCLEYAPKILTAAQKGDKETVQKLKEELKQELQHKFLGIIPTSNVSCSANLIFSVLAQAAYHQELENFGHSLDALANVFKLERYDFSRTEKEMENITSLQKAFEDVIKLIEIKKLKLQEIVQVMQDRGVKVIGMDKALKRMDQDIITLSHERDNTLNELTALQDKLKAPEEAMDMHSFQDLDPLSYQTIATALDDKAPSQVRLRQTA